MERVTVYTTSGWFNLSSNLLLMLFQQRKGIGRRGASLQVSSAWFDYTEPYLTAASQEDQGV